MKDQDYILFENYIAGTLSNEDALAFENKLASDLNFNQSFNTYKELSSFLEHEIANEESSTAFQSNLKSISNVYFDKNAETKNRFKPWQFGVAASVLLLISIVLFDSFSTPVYSDYAITENISLHVRGEQDALLKTAENAFNAKDFKKADEAFKSLLIIENENSEIILYRAIANIELNNFELAEAMLNTLIKGESVYKNKAIWYMALSNLKQKEYDECLEILKTIPEDADEYKKAQKLIRKLD